VSKIRQCQLQSYFFLLAWFWGDPHFTTLDNFTYTFNGLGEYVLLRAPGENVEFQARTTLVPSSNATVFSAFAIQHEDVTIQVQYIVSWWGHPAIRVWYGSNYHIVLYIGIMKVRGY